MKTFKIAFVLPNGVELFYAYHSGIPYLTKNIGAAYNFSCEYYITQGLREDEAARLKEGFFGALDVIYKVIQ